MKSRGEAEGPLGVRLTRRQLLQAGAVVGLGAGLASSGLLAACGSSGSGTGAAPTASSRAIKRGGVFTFATDQLFPKDGLDPLKNIDDGQDALEGMLREGLVSYDFKFQPVPRLAQTWDVNPELTEYTFHLRPNVTWHDGTPFTAKDAAWSIERIMSPEGGSGMMQRLDSSIDKNGVVVVDDLTLKLKLKRPDSLLLLALSNQQCYLVKANSKEADYAKGIGTGPFKLKFYNEGQSFEVDKNPAYWMTGYPIVDTVRGIQDPEESTKLQSVASGAASVTQVSFDQLAVVKANSKLQVNPYEKGITYCVVCDCTTKPFSDPRVRQALKLSIDRDNVINIAYGGQGFASPDAWVAMDDPFMNDTLIATTKMDRAKATQLMTAAGYAERHRPEPEGPRRRAARQLQPGLRGRDQGLALPHHRQADPGRHLLGHGVDEGSVLRRRLEPASSRRDHGAQLPEQRAVERVQVEERQDGRAAHQGVRVDRRRAHGGDRRVLRMDGLR